MRILACVLATTLLGGPAPVIAADSPRCPVESRSRRAAVDFTAARRWIEQVMRVHHVPAMAIGVARDGAILWEQGFGQARVHTMFSLASVSKPITATGLMVLVDRGEVDLGRPVNEYLGETGLWAGAGLVQDATVERVANHTAGLPTHYHAYFDQTPGTIDAAIRDHGVLLTPPGERYHYSNLGYGVLARVIEKVSGLGYERFMVERVFLPLGMVHTTVGPDRNRGKALERYGEDGRPLPYYDFDHQGGSSLYACVHDLLGFGTFHLGHDPEGATPLSLDARERMRRTLSPAETYGLGWGVQRIDGHETFDHNGSMPGVATRLLGFPREDVAIVVLANRRITPQLEGIVVRIMDALGLSARSDAICGLDAKHPLIGRWEGTTKISGEARETTLAITADGRVTLQVGDGPSVGLRLVHLHGTELSGVALRPPWPVAGSDVPSFDLSLKLRDDRLTGAIGLGTPLRLGVAHWVELTKTKA